MAQRSANGRRSTRALIVDDNAAFAENVAEILALQGIRAEVAGSAEEAWDLALESDVTTLITDYRLPGMTGAELVHRILARRRNLAAIVVSAFTDEGTVRAARTAGAHFLPKPLDLVLLQTYLSRERSE